jgi:hypothetical protein
MRSLLITGVIVAFIATSFVMPSQESLAALSADARGEIEKTAESALMNNIPSQKEWHQVATVMSAMAKDPVIIERLNSANIGVSGVSKEQMLDSTAKTLKNIAKQSLPTAKKKVVSYLRPKQHPSPEWNARTESETDPTRQALLALIKRAETEKNIRLCTAGALPEKRDFFALCLARVTQKTARCEQVSSRIQEYKELCLAEFSS